ncbi:MAG: hypothetical protein NXI31_15710 [bacterium]|nr:hypothetical protein [bacterium]
MTAEVPGGIYFSPPQRYCVHPTTVDAVRAGLRAFGDGQIVTRFRPSSYYPYLPLEATRVGYVAAALAAIRGREPGEVERSVLAISGLAQDRAARFGMLDADAITGFLREWRAREPAGDWGIWAMFLLVHPTGEQVNVFVRRPRRPRVIRSVAQRAGRDG